MGLKVRRFYCTCAPWLQPQQRLQSIAGLALSPCCNASVDEDDDTLNGRSYFWLDSEWNAASILLQSHAITKSAKLSRLLSSAFRTSKQASFNGNTCQLCKKDFLGNKCAQKRSRHVQNSRFMGLQHYLSAIIERFVALSMRASGASHLL